MLFVVIPSAARDLVDDDASLLQSSLPKGQVLRPAASGWQRFCCHPEHSEGSGFRMTVLFDVIPSAARDLVDDDASLLQSSLPKGRVLRPATSVTSRRAAA